MSKSTVEDLYTPALIPTLRDSPKRQKLKLLLLNYEFPPMGGGAGNATKHTAMALANLGHTVHVLTSRLPGQPSVTQCGKVTVHHVVSPRRSIHECGLIGAVSYLLFGFFRMRRLAAEHEFDIYHFYFGLPTGLLSVYVRWVLRKPYIISLRGSDVPGYDRTRAYLQPLHWLLRPLSRTIWRNASAVIALSDSLRSLAHDVSPRTDIGVIRNGIDTKTFPRRRDELAITPVRLICVCRLIRRKGLEFIVEAMRSLRNDGMTLEIAGTGEREQEIVDLVSNYGLADCISLRGYVDRQDLYEYYHRADIFVLPSISESFGQVLLEAMSTGLPVVASRVGGVPETIEHGVSGLLVEPGSSADLSAAIRSLAKDPSLRKKMGAHNAKIARTRFSWDSVAAEYENIYLRHTDNHDVRHSG